MQQTSQLRATPRLSVTVTLAPCSTVGREANPFGAESSAEPLPRARSVPYRIRLAWGAAPGALLALLRTLSTSGPARVEVLLLSGVITKATEMGESVFGACPFDAQSVTVI